MDTIYKDRDREKNFGLKLLSVMIILVLEVIGEVIEQMFTVSLTVKYPGFFTPSLSS